MRICISIYYEFVILNVVFSQTRSLMLSLPWRKAKRALTICSRLKCFSAFPGRRCCFRLALSRWGLRAGAVWAKRIPGTTCRHSSLQRFPASGLRCFLSQYTILPVLKKLHSTLLLARVSPYLQPLLEGGTPSPPIKSLFFRWFDASRLLILTGGNYHVRWMLQGVSRKVWLKDS